MMRPLCWTGRESRCQCKWELKERSPRRASRQRRCITRTAIWEAAGLCGIDGGSMVKLNKRCIWNNSWNVNTIFANRNGRRKLMGWIWLGGWHFRQKEEKHSTSLENMKPGFGWRERGIGGKGMSRKESWIPIVKSFGSTLGKFTSSTSDIQIEGLNAFHWIEQGSDRITFCFKQINPTVRFRKD